MLNFLIDNWAETFIIIQTVVRLTPTKADDKIVSKWGKVLKNIMVGSRTKKER